MIGIICLSFAAQSCTSFKSYTNADGKPGMVPDLARKSLGVPYFLPKSVLLVRGEYLKPEKEGGKRKYMVTVSQVTRADHSAPQFLHIKENPMYDEKSDIKVGPNGLLTSVNATPNDRTADIIKTVVGTAIDVAKIANGGVFGAPNVAPAPDQKVPLFGEFDVEIDPFSSSSCQKAAAEMEEAGWNFVLNAWGKDAATNKAVSAQTTESHASHINGKKPEQGDETPGPVYRLPTPVVFRLKARDRYVLPADAVNGGAGVPNRPEFILPVPGTYAYVPIKRGFMTQRTTNVTFSNGMPTEVSLTQPSPVLAFVKLPADLVKMVGDALPTLVKVENKTTPVSALDQIKADNAMLEQRLKQLEYQQKIRDLGGSP